MRGVGERELVSASAPDREPDVSVSGGDLAQALVIFDPVRAPGDEVHGHADLADACGGRSNEDHLAQGLGGQGARSASLGASEDHPSERRRRSEWQGRVGHARCDQVDGEADGS